MQSEYEILISTSRVTGVGLIRVSSSFGPRLFSVGFVPSLALPPIAFPSFLPQGDYVPVMHWAQRRQQFFAGVHNTNDLFSFQ